MELLLCLEPHLPSLETVSFEYHAIEWTAQVSI